MAEVFLARTAGPAGFSKTVAIKRIHPHLATDPSFVEMFIDEGRVAARLTHPNIVQIIDLGEAGGEYFLAMEHVHGRTLGEVIGRAAERGEALPLGVVLTVAANVLSALRYAHARPEGAVVHRDVTPHNILVAFDGHVKLVDFGIAKAKDRVHKTRAGVVKGKARYMPPEQLGAKRVDGRADLYALGAVLHETLSGVKLFSDLNDAQLFDPKRKRQVVAPSAWRADVPPELDALVLRLLSHDADARPPNAAAVLEAIEHIMLRARTVASSERVADLMRTLWSAHERQLAADGFSAADISPADKEAALREVSTADAPVPDDFADDDTDSYAGAPTLAAPTSQLRRDEDVRTQVRASPAVLDVPTRPRQRGLHDAATYVRPAAEAPPVRKAGLGIVVLGAAGVVALVTAVVLAVGFGRDGARSEGGSRIRVASADSRAPNPKPNPNPNPEPKPSPNPEPNPSPSPNSRPNPNPSSGTTEAHTKTALRKEVRKDLRKDVRILPPRPRPRRRRRDAAWGRVVIESVPPAQVYRAGVVVGRTPWSAKVRAGPVRLSLRGGQPRFQYALAFEVRAGETVTKRVRVPRARLRVGAVPWARVLIDGRYVDDTPTKLLWLYAGPHRLELVYPAGAQKLRHVRRIDVRGGEDLRVTYDFRNHQRSTPR
ncbi:MAG: serine/threonine protein kinase [Myxococcales bacterium]|nr:serine/threonine protein kinase [Myxococcales bacterium]